MQRHRHTAYERGNRHAHDGEPLLNHATCHVMLTCTGSDAYRLPFVRASLSLSLSLSPPLPRLAMLTRRRRAALVSASRASDSPRAPAPAPTTTESHTHDDVKQEQSAHHTTTHAPTLAPIQTIIPIAIPATSEPPHVRMKIEVGCIASHSQQQPHMRAYICIQPMGCDVTLICACEL